MFYRHFPAPVFYILIENLLMSKGRKLGLDFLASRLHATEA